MGRALSAKTFTLSSYTEDIFNGFGPPLQNGTPVSIPPQSASSRKRSAAIKNQKPVIIKEKEVVPAVAKHVRSRVPHDFPLENHHDCDLTTRVFSNTFHPRSARQKGLYGKTNRISYLRSIFNDEHQSDQLLCPSYPPSYHGPGGESKSLALGLTEAGCSSESRTLQAPSTFGLLNSKRSERKVIEPNMSSESIKKRVSSKNSAAGVATNFFDVLNISKSSSFRSSATDSLASQASQIATRYSANRELDHRTQTLVQPVQNSSSWCSEQTRLSRAPFVDDIALRERAHKAFKLNNVHRVQRNALTI